MATLGYIVVGDGRPKVQCQWKGFSILGAGGGSRPYCTVFPKRDDAKTALIADREYRRLRGQAWDEESHVVRLQSE